MEINDESLGNYNKDNQIRFKTSMLRLSLFDYSDAYILFKGTISVAKATAAALDNANEKVILKNFAPFTKCIRWINNTQDDAHDIDIVMPMYILIEYSDNCSKPLVYFWQYCRDELDLNNGAIVDFNILIRLKLNKK